MKKVIGVVAATIILGGAGAALLSVREGPESVRDRAAQTVAGIADRGRDALGFDRVEPGVVALVNGRPITLKQVEALYDMSTPALALGAANSLDRLRFDYAGCLRRLIMQSLIRQELEAAGLAVSEDDVRGLEELISSGYDVEAGPAFDRFIEEEGVHPDMWREQLRARLELERWRAELGRGVVVPESAVEEYVAAHPEVRELPEEVDCLLVSGSAKAAVAAARASGESDVPELRARGLDVRRFDGATSSVPEIWRETVSALSPGELSAEREIGGAWRYVVLLERRPPRARTPLEVYAHAERILTERNLPELFDQWLESALARSEIRMAGALTPASAPPPAPEPEAKPSAFPDEILATGAAGEEDMP